MERICTKGTLRIHAAILPQVYALKRSDWTAKGQRTEWELWDKDPTLNLPESERSVTQANHRVVEDWLEAIATNREPACSGYAAMKALEMAMAVFEAGLSRKRAGFPLANRRHPLAA